MSTLAYDHSAMAALNSIPGPGGDWLPVGPKSDDMLGDYISGLDTTPPAEFLHKWAASVIDEYIEERRTRCGEYLTAAEFWQPDEPWLRPDTPTPTESASTRAELL